MEIIQATETAVLAASVTVSADSAPRALELAESELSRECRKLGKVAATPQYKLVSRIVLEGQGGYQYEIVFGEFNEYGQLTD